MCGFAGFLGGNFLFDSHGELGALENMLDKIRHRGPDDQGLWFDASQLIGLGHRRLSIVDLSRAGHQPMHSRCSRYLIAFNGEIYNHLELRHQLIADGYFEWNGHSDTETLLACISAWGLEQALEKISGMFAFALWDTWQNKLKLIRDRVGEKPLYYGWQKINGEEIFLFGSELKSLKNYPLGNFEIDRNSLSLFMQYGYIPAPFSVYKDVFKLKPGSILTVSKNERGKLQSYWSFGEVARTGLNNQFQGDLDEASKVLEANLSTVISEQMLADVSVGAFLSGGVDSSTVVAIMQQHSVKPVKTFSIGFDEEAYDESKSARKISKYLGTDHTEMIISAQDVAGVIPLIPTIYDEPFADSSQIPTFLVAKLAATSVKVSLSGDGGDEVFCGYNRYLYAEKIWRYLRFMPLNFKKWMSFQINGLTLNQIKLVASFLPIISRQNLPVDKLLKLISIINSDSKEVLYEKLLTNVLGNENVVNGSELRYLDFSGKNYRNMNLEFQEKMMLFDSENYLPDDILVKLDRATMAVSLETRVPMLDRRIIEFAWSLPHSFKIDKGVTKKVLRNVLYEKVPENLFRGSKMGFGLPIGDWIRGPLRPWVEDCLSENALQKAGYLNVDLVRGRLDEHLKGQRNWQAFLWSALMLQAWLEAQ